MNANNTSYRFHCSSLLGRRIIALCCIVSLVILPLQPAWAMSSTVEYYHYNHQGSLLEVYDGATNKRLLSQAWSPWGERQVLHTAVGNKNNVASLLASGLPVRMGYTGHKELLATGLAFAGDTRLYDARLKRFLNSDDRTTGGIRGQNRYSYAYNNPMTYIDPDGHVPTATIHPQGVIDGGRTTTRRIGFRPYTYPSRIRQSLAFIRQSLAPGFKPQRNALAWMAANVYTGFGLALMSTASGDFNLHQRRTLAAASGTLIASSIRSLAAFSTGFEATEHAPARKVFDGPYGFARNLLYVFGGNAVGAIPSATLIAEQGGDGLPLVISTAVLSSFIVLADRLHIVGTRPKSNLTLAGIIEWAKESNLPMGNRLLGFAGVLFGYTSEVFAGGVLAASASNYFAESDVGPYLINGLLASIYPAAFIPHALSLNYDKYKPLFQPRFLMAADMLAVGLLAYGFVISPNVPDEFGSGSGSWGSGSGW